MKKILIGCEESGTITNALRAAGYEAYSNDLLPTRGNPDWHIQGDVMAALHAKEWGLIVLHPDCTAMAVSGNRWYGKGMPLHSKRLVSVEWTVNLWSMAVGVCDHVAMENPVSVLFNRLPNVFYLQPWQHGHGETKKTGFALHGLDPLEPSNVVEGRENRVWKMAPSENRKRDRSKTFQGVADAIVKQWATVVRP